MSTSINKATVNDLQRINDLYSAVKADKDMAYYSGWLDEYPDLVTAKTELEKGGLFFIENENKVVASFSLNDHFPPEYDQVSFKHKCKKALCVHTLCIRPGFEKRGLATMTLDFTKQYAKENGFDCIKLDTYIKNKPALALYLKNGFELASIHPFCYDGVITELYYVFQFIIN